MSSQQTSSKPRATKQRARVSQTAGANRKSQAQDTKRWHLSVGELRTIGFISVLLLAGLALALRVDSPAIWGFLATAIGVAMGLQRTGW